MESEDTEELHPSAEGASPAKPRPSRAPAGRGERSLKRAPVLSGPRGWAVAAVLLFLLIVLLDGARIYFQEYSATDRLFALQSLLMGAQPALVFWVVICADLLRTVLVCRLLMLAIPGAAQRRRWLTLATGLPLAGAGVMAFDLAFFLLAEQGGAAGFPQALVVCGLAGIVAGVLLAGLVSLGVWEGTEGVGKLGLGFIQALPLAVAFGVPVFALLKLSYFLTLVPFLGLFLRPAFDLGLGLWFLRRLALQAGKTGALHEPGRPGLAPALAAGLAGFGLIALCVLVPGPAYHPLDAVAAPPFIPNDSHLLPSRYQDFGTRVELSSQAMKVVIDKDPFHFAILDRENRTLLELNPDLNQSPADRGAAVNLELRGLRMVPPLGPGRLLLTRIRLGSTPLAVAPTIRDRAGEIIAEGKAGGQPLNVGFAFTEEDILKITVDVGPRSRWRSASIAFVCDRRERFLVGGNGVEGGDQRGRDLSFLAQDQGAEPAAGTALGRWLSPFLSGPDNGGGRWPVPFVFLSRGVGVFLAEASDPRMEVAGAEAEAIRFASRGGPLHLYVITGASPFEVLEKYFQLLGPRAPLPPSALMPWTSVTREQACHGEAAQEMAALRQLAIPAENLFVGGDWSDFFGAPETRPCPELANAAREAQAQGFRLMAADQAWLPRGGPAYEEAVKEGFLVLNRMGLPYHFLGPGGSRTLLDFSNPAAARWHAQSLRRLTDLGFSAFLLDPAGLPPPDAILYNGAGGDEARNLFPLIYARAMKSHLGPEVLLAAGTGFAGMEKDVALVWPLPWSASPDLPRELLSLLAQGLGGLPTAGPQVPPSLSDPKALSDFPDRLRVGTVCGLMNLPPVFRGSAPAAGPELVKTVATLAEIHARLLAYLYSLTTAPDKDGPMLSPVALLEPENGSWDRNSGQFLVGEALMAATGEKVSFPAGRFVDLESLALYQAGTYEIPPGPGPRMFLREGQILPVFSKAFHTLAGPEGPDRRRGSLNNEITLIWISGASADFTLFDGAQISAAWGLSTIALRVRGGQPRPYAWRVLWCPPPEAVFVNGRKVGPGAWRFQEASGVLTVPGLQGPDLSVDVAFGDSVE